MQMTEIKELWTHYDQQLNQIETTNRHILKRMILENSQKRINWLTFQNIMGIIIPPVILFFVLIPVLQEMQRNFIVNLGFVTICLVFAFYLVYNIYFMKGTAKLKISSDPVIKTKEKLIRFKQFGITLQKIRNFLYPLLSAGMIMMFWTNISYPTIPKVLVLGISFIGIYFWGKMKYQLYFQNTITELEKEMQEIKELN